MLDTSTKKNILNFCRSSVKQKETMKMLLFVFSVIWEIRGTSSLPTIEIIPPTPNNILATGYTGLVVTAQFEKEDFTSYVWRCNKDKICQITDQFFVHGADGCFPRSSSTYTITCILNKNDVITSNLTYLQPVKTNLDPSIRKGSANGDIIILLPTQTVQDCPQRLENDVTVQYDSASYNDTGIFTCPINRTLFYKNGSQPASDQTTCLYTAEWSGQDNVSCWTAPTPVTMNATNGVFTVVKGNGLTVACEYKDVIPKGTNNTFYLNRNEVGRQQKRSFTLFLQPEDNNKQVSCQAVTPYTEIFKESGRSPQYTINVQYAPFPDKPTSCQWFLNQPGSCDVPFMSNPQAELLALIKNNSGEKLEGGKLVNVVGSMSQTFQFMKTPVEESDKGIYILHLKSSVSPYNHTIEFKVDVKNLPADNRALVIALAVTGAVLAIIIIIAVILICCKRRKAQEKSNGNSSARSNGGINEAIEGNAESPAVVYSHVVKKSNKNGTSDKEERFNPLYVSSDQAVTLEPAYAAVDKKKKKKDSSQKVEKVNPLYVSADQPDKVEPAYGMVKKGKKKKATSEKEERVNPLYVSSDQPAGVEPAYGVVNKKKKKAGANKEVNQHAAYAEVNKPRKKKTSPTLHSQDGGGEQVSVNDVVLHGIPH